MRSTVKSDGPATVLYSISYFYDVFGTAIRAFTKRLARSRAIFDGGRNVFGWFSVAQGGGQVDTRTP